MLVPYDGTKTGQKIFNVAIQIAKNLLQKLQFYIVLNVNLDLFFLRQNLIKKIWKNVIKL